MGMNLTAGSGSTTAFPASNPLVKREYDINLVYVFIGFQLFGLFGALFTLIGALLSSVKRYASWYSFMGSWVMSSISYTLLFFGNQLKEPKPSLGLCMAQASLIYAAPPHTAASTLGLVVQIWFNVHEGLGKKPISGRRIWTRVFLFVPWILWVLIVVESLTIASLHPKTVKKVKSGMYCNTRIIVPGRISAALVSVILILAVIVEVIIISSIRKKWKSLRQQTVASMVVRVTIFVIFGFFAIILAVTFTFMIQKGAELNIIVSIFPVTAILLFGTQRDLLNAWMFWKWRRQSAMKAEEEFNRQPTVIPNPTSAPAPRVLIE